MRKNRRRRIVRSSRGDLGAARPNSDYVPSESSSSHSTSGSSVNGEVSVSRESSPISTLSTSQNITDPLYHCDNQFQVGPVPSRTSSVSNYSQISNALHNNIPHVLFSVFHEYGPIVNSSLMFFASRTDSQNLYLLAKYTNMIPRAVEILLRNWKAGGDYMQYALRFLKDSSYCATLLSVNWTRWTHRDETLFDLIEIYVPEEEQAALTKAVLKADLMFRHPLERLHAAWASTWRIALQKEEWKVAIEHLLKLRTFEVSHALLNCALEVVTEEFLRRNKATLENWKGDEEPFPEQTRRQYMDILQDCRKMQINVDSSLQGSMRVTWAP
jgi:hypothetical protein